MKNIAIVFLLFLPLSLMSQDIKREVQRTIKETENTKSGNFQDVISSFYQVAFKSISQNEKGLEFNSSLFSILKTVDGDILQTRSRSGINFYRNLNIGGKINMDSQYNVEAYGISMSYSLINDRNREFIDLTGTNYHHVSDEFENLVRTAIGTTAANIITAAPVPLTDNEKIDLSNELHKIGTAILNNNSTSVNGEAHYANFIAALDALIAMNPIYNLNGSQITVGGVVVTNTQQAAGYMNVLRQQYYDRLENAPLLTISTDGSFNTDGKFDRGNIEGIFLAGTSFGEWDARAKFSYVDTLATQPIRTNLNAKFGYNFKVLKRSDKSSVFELKFYGEYNKILRNPLPEEKEDTFLANADIRIRLTDDLWLPFTIKYDIENANVLGFLNITYNFGDD